MPFDLTLPAPDRHHVMLLGMTNDAAQYRARVEQAINEKRAAHGNTDDQISIELQGHWSPDHALDALQDLLEVHTETEETDATVSTHR